MRVALQTWLRNLLYVLIGVVAPLLVILVNILFDLVGIVLALAVMGPLLS